MRRSSRNFQYPLVHQFYAWCQKEHIVSMIGWLLMTSEWRHVLSIQAKNKGLRETPWHIHVWRYNRSVFAKRLRIIRAIRLLSRNFEFFKILKIVKINNKKFSFVFFFSKKIIFSNKPEYMWNIIVGKYACQISKLYLEKSLQEVILNQENNHFSRHFWLFPWFSYFQVLSDFGLKKRVIVSFFVFVMKIWSINMHWIT